MKTDPATELMETIREEAGGLYLSDLHEARFAKYVAQAVRGIPADAYSLAVWEETASYILRKKQSFASAEEAKETLLTGLLGA